MKFSLIAVLISGAYAFTPLSNAARPVSQLFVMKTSAEGIDAVDRSMKGIDAEGSFDPTEGDGAALTRNNKGEVWNLQVCSQYFFAIIRCVMSQQLIAFFLLLHCTHRRHY